VFIFLAIGVGLAAGMFAPAVAALDHLRGAEGARVTRIGPRLGVLAGIWVAAGACASGHTARRAMVPVPPASPADVDVTLYLIGDAGDPAPGHEPVLAALEAQAAARGATSVIVFLGDNVYPRGLPDSGDRHRPEAERRLDAQVEVLERSGARGIFVPGNHDWDEGGEGGWDGIRREGVFLAGRRGARVELLPTGGCPGPAVVDVGRTLRLALLDTQWWLRGKPKPEGPGSSCPTHSEGEVVDSLRGVLRDAGRRRVAVLAHHPLASGGPHGGHFDWQAHVFPLRALAPWLWVPLPVIGSIYPVARQHGISNQDMSGSRYRRLRAGLASAFAEHPPLVYGSGHDHALQVITGNTARYLLVSGSGYLGHFNYTTWLDSTRFAQSASGFMRLDLLRDGRTRLGVTVVDERGEAREAFSMWLD